MGFGFNFLMILVIIPVSIIVFIIWLFWRQKMLLQILGIIWGGILCLVLLVATIHFFTDKKEVKRADIFGEYVIDRTKFPGRQADWQYAHYSFEITQDQKFLFHRRNQDTIVHTDSGLVNFAELEGYELPRLQLNVDSPRNHIINDVPILYRTHSSFYYVFRSPNFGNVFFTRGKWKPLEK